MNRIAPRLGLKLADYNHIFGVPTARRTNPVMLLKSRTKQRYFNPVQNDLECMTVLSRVLQSDNPRAHELLQQRLPEIDLTSEVEKLKNSCGESKVHQLMAKYNKTPAELSSWVRCSRAKSITEALDSMNGQEWPTFLLLHTFNRPISTRRDAWKLIKLYEEYIGAVGYQYQLELCWLALDVAQNQLIEYLVPIVRLFIKSMNPSLEKRDLCNELLWKLSKYGTQWSIADLQVIKAAQQKVVQEFGSATLDKKGYTALAYIAHFESRELAVQIINGAPAAPASQTDLPYLYGTKLIQLNSCKSFEDGLAILNSVPEKDRKSAIWEAFLQGLVSGGFLDFDDEVVLKLYRYWKTRGIRPSSIMIGLVIRKVNSFKVRRQILDEFLGLPNINLTPSLLVNAMAPVSNISDFVQVKKFLYKLGRQHALTQKILVRFLAMQAHWEPQTAWETYKHIQAIGDPSSDAVAYLCQAAYKSDHWNGVLAVQQAVVEAKQWIQQDSDENLKSYPTELLVHSYIVLLGKANYQFELDNVMTWLHRIQFKPTKRILSALIVHSQYGDTMQKLASKSHEWPTEKEIELYRMGNSSI